MNIDVTDTFTVKRVSRNVHEHFVWLRDQCNRELLKKLQR